MQRVRVSRAHRRTGQAFGGRAGPYFAQIRMMKIPEKDKSTGNLPKYLAYFARIWQNLKLQGGQLPPLKFEILSYSGKIRLIFGQFSCRFVVFWCFSTLIRANCGFALPQNACPVRLWQYMVIDHILSLVKVYNTYIELYTSRAVFV